MGEKGTGKTSAVKSIAGEQKLIIASCASFSDDTMAESILFGHKKGAFTGAGNDHEGNFRQADGGILFLDEIHTLTPRVQEKLLLSLQTEGEGKYKGHFRIQPLGAKASEYVFLQPIFATNVDLETLKKKLLPDFYDRISQIVIEFPSLNESVKGGQILEVFRKVWENMKFKKHSALPDSKEFQHWFKKQHFPGNYRDLDTIAILWNKARQMYDGSDSASFEFMKTQFEKFHSEKSMASGKSVPFFIKGRTKKEIDKAYRKALYEWGLETYESVGEMSRVLDFKRPDSLLK